MGTFKMMSKNELRTRRKLPPEDVILFDQFKGYVMRLSSSDVVLYEFAKGEARERCKKLLRQAARSVGVRVRMKEETDSLVFYAPRARRSPAAAMKASRSNGSA